MVFDWRDCRYSYIASDWILRFERGFAEGDIFEADTYIVEVGEVYEKMNRLKTRCGQDESVVTNATIWSRHHAPFSAAFFSSSLSSFVLLMFSLLSSQLRLFFADIPTLPFRWARRSHPDL